MHRLDLNDLQPAERQDLAQLIQQHATPAVISDHANAPPQVHFDGSLFLSWHRAYLRDLEDFLEAQGHPEWTPLPAWNPARRIPDEFNVPDSGPGALQDLTPEVDFSPAFDHRNLADFRDEEELGMELMEPHNEVHNRVGGVMATFQSPRAPIFWPWHSFLDDIWWEWQRQTVVVPDCAGLRRTQARRLLATVGLEVGEVDVARHRHAGGGRQHRRHVVVDQLPDPGDRAHHRAAVDLVLGRAR